MRIVPNQLQTSNRIYQKFLFLLAGVLFFSLCPARASAEERLQSVGDVVTIVIDPGHGGENGGTQSGNRSEKEMTMITATAMYDELCKYDNVNVYMTHTDDRDYSLKERAEFAASKNADFLFSIHYNASEDHSMFGSEVWISCQPPYHGYGYQFGYLHLTALQEKGLYIRGVKTRIDEKNHDDYYGIIREAVALSVPSVIIEHCYVDEERDADYIKDEKDYAAFGVADALSVAKYFGLKSSLLGVDYSAEASNLRKSAYDSLVPQTKEDKTSPDVCEIEVKECDYETGDLTLTVHAADYDSILTYYDYSIDGGKTFSRWEKWPGTNTLTFETTDTFELHLKIPEGKKPAIVLRAYNMYDYLRSSNTIYFDQKIQKYEHPEEETVSAGTPAPFTPVEHERKTAGTTTFMPVVSDSVETEENVNVLTFLKFCLALVVALFLIVLTTQTLHYNKRRKKRRNR